jgi:hypothetical protein
MPSKAKIALATLLVFGSASAALAESNNGANHRGPVVWGRTTPTMLEQRNANTSSRPRKRLGSTARAASSEAIVAESKPGGSFQHVLSLHYAQQ